MSAWTNTSEQTAARSYAATGLPAGDLDGTPLFIAGVFSPDAQTRKLLYGLVSPEEMNDAVDSCFAIACNEHRIMLMTAGMESQVASLMCVVAQVFAHGILYGRQTAADGA